MPELSIGLCLLNRNEESGVLQVISQINRGLFTHIFAVDGLSSDASPDLIENAGIRVLKQSAQGRGNAFAIAFLEARKLNVDALVFLSTDGNEDPKDLSRHVEILKNGADISIGSRMLPEAFNEEDVKLFRPRKWANNIFMWMAFILFGLGQTRITDPINGYRGISSSAWKRLKLDAAGFDIEYQSSVRAYKLKMKVVEFETHEYPRIGGKSGATAFRTTYKLTKVLIKELL